jgi:transposase-like protein
VRALVHHLRLKLPRSRCDNGRARHDHFSHGVTSSDRRTPKRLRARRGRLGDCWPLDEVFLRINGRLQYLWRAVDQDGEGLDILVKRPRRKQAAEKFFRKLLKGLQYIPRAIITDKLRSYPAAMAEVMSSVQIKAR